jgi:hypothetical protein
MTKVMALAPEHADGPVHEMGRVQPLVYAAVVLGVFVTTVIVLAVKAGTGTAMVITLVAIVVAGTMCGLWGTTMAARGRAARRTQPPVA